MAQELETLEVALVAETSEFKSGLDSADNIAKGWASKLGGAVGGLITGALAVGATAAVGAVLTIGTAAFDVSSQVHAAAGDMAASLGIPTEEAREFAEVARDVYGNNFADSVTDAAAAVTEVAKQLDLAATDPALQTITENAFRLRDAFGVEVSDSVNAVKTLMDQFGLSSDQAFDMLATAYQRGMDSSGDLLDTIGEYSVQFSNGGASASDFFKLIETGMQGGVLGTDKAADAFKEFGIRILDNSTLTQDSLATLGISYDELSAGFADGSVTTIDAMRDVLYQIFQIEDPIQRATVGVGLFGTQWEDLGESSMRAIAEIEEGFGTQEDGIESLDKQYNTMGDAVEGIWRRLIVSVSPFTDKLLELVNSAMPTVMDAFDKFDAAVGPTMDGIGSTINTVVTFVNGLWEQFGESIDVNALGPLEYWQEWADKNLPMVQELFNNILSAIQGFWAIFGDDIMHIVENTFNNALLIIDTIMRTIGDVITLVLQLLTGDWEGAWTTMEGITQRIWDTIVSIVSTQIDSIMTAVTSFDWLELGRSIVEGMIDGIVAMSSALWDAAREVSQNLWDSMTGWWSTGSPSKKAEIGLGEPIGQGMALGIAPGLRSVMGRVDTAMQGLFNDLSAPQPAMAGVGGERPTITLNIYLQGSATYEDGREVGRGVDDELRSRGW